MRHTLASSLLAIASVVIAPGWSVQAQPAQTQSIAAFAAEGEQHWGLLESYCMGCHNFTDFAGDLALDLLSPATVPEDADAWEKVIRKLRGRTMPPPGEDRPEEGQYDELVAWLEGYLDHAAATNPNPGQVGLHRLNRTEYLNSINDILGVDWIEKADLLPDDTDYAGFDSIASALIVTPGYLERYLTAAWLVAVDAVGQRDPLPTSATFFLEPDAEGHQAFHMHGAPLGSRGGITAYWYFPGDGEYMIDIEDLFPGDIYYSGGEHLNTLLVAVNDRIVYQADIGGPDDVLKIDKNQSPAITAMNQRLKNIRFTAEAGPAVIWVGFQHRSFAESEYDLYNHDWRGGFAKIINLTGFQISGPFNSTGLSQTVSRQKIFTCYPESQVEEAACAEEILVRIATQAYRRPLQNVEFIEILDYYTSGVEQGGFEEGIRSGITGILSSPEFLYRATVADESRQIAEGIYALSDHEMASRLSFFLWRSVPDAELLAVAADGTLSDPQVLEAQVLRMLADPRSFSLATEFAYQWLHLDKIHSIVPFNPLLFPYFSTHRTVVHITDGGDANPHLDMIQEVLLFVDAVFRENASVVDLLSANYTYLNERVAVHYGIHNVKGNRFRRVELDDSVRWGLLGKAAVLMVTSYPDRTAPVLRGEWILANLIGAPPSPPPPNVEALLPENEFGAGQFLTVAERLQAHSTDPSCYACHGVMDPLGFALENFNAVGVWRHVEEFTDVPVSTNAGMMPDGAVVDGPDALRDYLLQRPEQFVQTFTEKLLMYALGRPLDYQYDMPMVRSIVTQAANDDYRFSSLVLAIVNSPAFQQMRISAGNGTIPSPLEAAPAPAPEQMPEALLEVAGAR